MTPYLTDSRHAFVTTLFVTMFLLTDYTLTLITRLSLNKYFFKQSQGWILPQTAMFLLPASSPRHLRHDKPECNSSCGVHGSEKGF